MNITLAIPNFNGASNIANILEQASNENFYNIYLLDDCSTDDSVKVAETFKNVTVIKGNRNLGPGGNRNRILDQHIGEIVTFIDVDMQFVSANLVNSVLTSFDKDNVGIVGGQILTNANKPMWWNYGYQMNPENDHIANKAHKLALKNWENEKYINELRSKYIANTYNLEISFGAQIKREVDWVSEANLSIRASIFKKLNGFDPVMRYHADQDICKRTRDMGYKVTFSPEIISKHLEIDSFGDNRNKYEKEGREYFLQKHKIVS